MPQMYLLAILRNKQLRSIRDLKGTHVEMLQQTSREIKEVLKEQMAVEADQIRLFFHYPPS